MTTMRLSYLFLLGSLFAPAVRAEQPDKGSAPVVITPPVTYSPLRTTTSSVPRAPRVAPVPPTPSLPPGSSPRSTGAASTVAVPSIEASPTRPAPQASRKLFAIGTDVGVPDGLHLALAVEPLSWMRLSVAGGSNTASYGGRLGLTLIPMGYGPSLSVEGGTYSVSEPSSLVRSFFKVPKWVEPYVQQIGYRYLNAQLGYDLRLGNFVVYLHGGYSYIRGIVRSPEAVVLDSTTGYTVRMRDDGVVRAYTWSLKAAVLYMFGGG